ncbi:hypothetical protein BON22_1000 [Cyberlindnera fabianii]|uniref:Uncharacterized protein n=1 Tax=Cyberlindnera fabianii TaxID=36022 RepID=A0A1V2LA84_CYBFA|nr:hypothetical protein BON22_1000 [Cyberlindnera fabianii]
MIEVKHQLKLVRLILSGLKQRSVSAERIYDLLNYMFGGDLIVITFVYKILRQQVCYHQSTKRIPKLVHALQSTYDTNLYSNDQYSYD